MPCGCALSVCWECGVYGPVFHKTLLHGYAEYGPDFLTKMHVNGMFAFVLYDAAKDIYIAARDPVGIIPLYFGHGRDGSCWFSSEIKAMQDNCETFQALLPGHVYKSETHDVEKWYTPAWSNMEVLIAPQCSVFC